MTKNEIVGKLLDISRDMVVRIQKENNIHTKHELLRTLEALSRLIQSIMDDMKDYEKI